MNDIDFLPKWYTSSKQRKVNYRRQYIIIAGVFLSLVAWSMSASLSLSIVQAQVNMMHRSLKNNESIEMRYNALKTSLEKMHERADLLEKLDSGVNISSLIAELSFLAGDEITVTKLDIISETLELKNGSKTSKGKSPSSGQNKNKAMPDDRVRFKIQIYGVASSTEDVTELIARLEQSDYLRSVIPRIMKNIKDSKATRFEITCYVANYIIE